MFRQATLLAFVMTMTTALPTLAADRDNAPAPASATATAAAGEAAPALAAWANTPELKRPVALSALYGAYGTLQVLDLVSTRKAIGAGAHEANPLMGSGAVGRMAAVKVATGAMSIYFAEKTWKKNRVGAVVLMAVINGASAAIVANNTRHAGK